MSFLRADIPRQTNNVLRIATVAAIDWEARQFRAQTGDITTNWLPFPAWISHNYRHWLPLRESAQIILTVDGGDYNTATVVGMLWSDDVPAPDIPVDDRPYIDRLVSIRAPARGATCLVFLVGVLIRGFNSRSREGSDPLRLTNQKDKICFNSRSREGSDRRARLAGRRRRRFNSRSREGSDAARGTGRGRRRGFNSRSREGSDTC